jgi:flagellar secretion chaperone FliS
MNPYFEQTILNADPVALTAMVYRKAIESIREARGHLRERRIKERSDAIMSAYGALVELLTALKPDAAPELAGRLQALYAYMMERLIEANVQQADGPLEEVLKLLLTISDGWAGVATAMREVTEIPTERPRLVVADARHQSGATYDDGVRLALTA